MHRLAGHTSAAAFVVVTVSVCRANFWIGDRLDRTGSDVAETAVLCRAFIAHRLRLKVQATSIEGCRCILAKLEGPWAQCLLD